MPIRANFQPSRPQAATGIASAPHLTRARLLAACSLTVALALALLLRKLPHAAFYPTCPIHLYLGLLCPGCGGTHAFAAMLRGDVAAAWHANEMLTLLAPLALLYLAALVARLWRADPKIFPPVPTPAIHLLLAVAALFTIARNPLF